MRRLGRFYTQCFHLFKLLYNKYHKRSGFYKTEMYFSQSWSGKFKIRAPAEPMSGWALASWLTDSCPLIVCSHGGRLGGGPAGSLVRTHILFMRVSCSWPKHLPRLHVQIPSRRAVGFNVWVWKEHKHSVLAVEKNNIWLLLSKCDWPQHRERIARLGTGMSGSCVRKYCDSSGRKWWYLG